MLGYLIQIVYVANYLYLVIYEVKYQSSIVCINNIGIITAPQMIIEM